MPKKQKKYKRLPGKRNSILFPSSLWLAQDHVLYVISLVISENYKRFYFQDIQSVTIIETRTWKRCNLVTGVLGALFVLSALLVSGNWSIFFWVMAVPSILLFIINSFLGPSCDCYIQTSVQKERLYPLNRIRTARKLIDIIKPLIEQAQGRLEPDALEKYRLPDK